MINSRLLLACVLVVLLVGVCVLPTGAQGLYGVVNGGFELDGAGWYWTPSSGVRFGNSWNSDLAARTGLGFASFASNSSTLISSPVLCAGSWELYFRSFYDGELGSVQVRIRDSASGLETLHFSSSSIPSNMWLKVTSSVYPTQTLKLCELVVQRVGSYGFSVDDVSCPQCLTPGYPYGFGTPAPVIVVTQPTIDWSRYPTPDWSRYPTPNWSTFPTVQPNVTNNNTTNNSTSNTTNVTNNNTTTGGTTIIMPDGSSVTAFPYGAGTPVPVVIATTPTPRPTAMNYAAGYSKVSMSPQEFLVRDSSFKYGGTGQTPYDFSGAGQSTANPLSFYIEKRNLTICLPDEISDFLVIPEANKCAVIPLPVVEVARLGSLDFTSFFLVVPAAYFLAFIIRQIQER